MDSNAFLTTAAAQTLVNEGRLVAFSVTTPQEVEVERIPFVTAPFEWCDEQLRHAAILTLDISEALLAQEFELKDASAWNVIFSGCRPMFCDHLSFRAIRRDQWWAFGQFFRHFSFPLAVSSATGLHGANAFRLSRDGLRAIEARRMLGIRRFGTRLWPLFLLSHAESVPREAEQQGITAPGRRHFHPHLYRYCRWSLDGRQTGGSVPSPWLDYTACRAHYPKQSQGIKAATVGSWLSKTRPAWLVDLGANTGEFTFMAVALGSKVIAVEQDAACITALYRKASGDPSIFPVLSNLADLCGGGGWLGSEHSGLSSRLRGMAQMVLALAVLHHLAISESIPLDRIAEFVADITTEYAIVELIPENDPMVLRLSAQRERRAHDFSLPAQQAAFGRHFITVATQPLEGSERQLVLLRRRTQ